jgi:hypothetical protein
VAFVLFVAIHSPRALRPPVKCIFFEQITETVILSGAKNPEWWTVAVVLLDPSLCSG